MSATKRKIPSYYAVFLLNERFDIDLEALEQVYMSMQMQAHPDQRGGNTDLSALLNEAHGVLANDLKRAEHLLELSDITLPELEQDFMADILMGNVETAKMLEKEYARLSVLFAAEDLEGAAACVSRIKCLERLVQHETHTN